MVLRLLSVAEACAQGRHWIMVLLLYGPRNRLRAEIAPHLERPARLLQPSPMVFNIAAADVLPPEVTW